MKQEPAESALVQTKPGFVGILAFFNGGEDVKESCGSSDASGGQQNRRFSPLVCFDPIDPRADVAA